MADRLITRVVDVDHFGDKAARYMGLLSQLSTPTLSEKRPCPVLVLLMSIPPPAGRLHGPSFSFLPAPKAEALWG